MQCIKKIYGCIMYADDILFLSPSVSGLQCMLDNADEFSALHGISFNAKKSVCVAIGRSCSSYITNMRIGMNSIPWVSEFKYLGINFCAGTRISVDCVMIRRKSMRR